MFSPSGIGDLSRFWLSCLGPSILLLPNTLFNIIIWPSNLSILSLPDEGYSRNASCALNLKSTFLFKLFTDSAHLET
jgi:hypothetical protein